MGFDFDESIGKKDMPLSWSEEAKKMLEEGLGNNWNTVLLYLWIDSIEMDQCINTRYTHMDIITRLYEKIFLLGGIILWLKIKSTKFHQGK